jgi:hypothetical protein
MCIIFPRIFNYVSDKNTNPEAEETKDVHVKDGKNSFKINSYNFKP